MHSWGKYQHLSCKSEESPLSGSFFVCVGFCCLITFPKVMLYGAFDGERGQRDLRSANFADSLMLELAKDYI